MSYYKVDIDITGVRYADIEYIGNTQTILLDYVKDNDLIGFSYDSFLQCGYFIINYIVSDNIKFIYYSNEDSIKTHQTIDSIISKVNRDKILTELLK